MALALHTIQDPEEGAKKAANTLAAILSKHSKQPTLLLVSGGSTVPMLAHIPPHVFGPHMTVVVLDERYSAEPAANNFFQLKAQPVYKVMIKAGCAFIETIPLTHESLEEFAIRYEEEIRGWRHDHPAGVMVATQGIGVDGHTVGIFPYPKEKEWFTKQFDATDRWVVGYDAENKNQYPLRATTTFPFLRALSSAVFYCYGEKKNAAVARALAKDGDLAATPGRIIHQMRDVHLFTDAILSDTVEKR